MYGKPRVFLYKLFAFALLFLIVLPSFSLATNDFYIKDADMVISVGKDWLYFTKDTQNVDLEDTAFNYEGVDELVQQQIALMNDPQYSDLKAVLLYTDGNTRMAEVQIAATQSDETKEIWDVSLHSEKAGEMDESITETYITKNDEKFFAVPQEDDYGELLTYLTINNGRLIAIHIRAYNIFKGTALDLESTYSVAHDLLDRVQFTKKDAKPTPALSTTKAKKSFWEYVEDLLSSTWSSVKHILSVEWAHQVSSTVVFVIGAAIYIVFLLIKHLVKSSKKHPNATVVVIAVLLIVVVMVLCGLLDETLTL